MNEFEIVEGLVKDVLPQLDTDHVEHVASVHFKRGSAFSEEVLREAYHTAAQGTPLEGAVLWVDTENVEYQCPCGYHQVITCNDLHDYVFVCPECGTGHKVDESEELELIELLAEMI